MDLLLTFASIGMRVLAYGAMLFALWTLTADLRQDVGRQVWYRIGRRRMVRRRDEAPRRALLPTALQHHLLSLLESALNRAAGDRTVMTFLRITVALGVSMAVAVLWSTRNIELTLVASILALLFPYFVLRYRLYNERLARSNQIHLLVQLLLSQYRIRGGNIYFALRDTADRLHTQHSSLTRPVARLLVTVQGMANEEEVLRALELFVYSIQTSLAQQLGAILSTALITKRPIEAQLRSLDEEITKIQQSLDEEKSERADNVGLGFLPIVAFPVVELFLLWQSGTKFLSLQFGGDGSTYFVLALTGSIAAFLIAIFTRRPKIDL